MSKPAMGCRAAVALTLLALLAGEQCLARRVLQQPAPGAPELDVVIIGAGIAGIAAARQLADAGLKVLVLEGRERSGGRLNSTAVPGGHVDLGAMWIHEGQAGNPLYDLTQKLGLPVSRRQDYSSIAAYSPDGQPSSMAAYFNVYRRHYTQLLPTIARMRSNPGTTDTPVSAVYSQWLQQQNFSPADMARANIIMHTQWQSLLNGNITSLSTLRLGDAKSIPAVDVMLKDGFDAVVRRLEAGLNITYNAVVTSIRQEADRVVVTAKDGRQFVAKFAIFTPSLGVLKAGDIAFEPALPEAKQRAIRDMGFGVLDKAVFVFDKPFWEKDLNSDFILREMPDWSGRWSIFLNYHKLFKIPVLVCIHVADTARSLERMTDTQVIGEGFAVLRRMYPGAPNPVQTAVTRWAEDPFARGSYSYFATGNPLNITAALAEPVGRLLFAGEATSIKPATVLGGYLSGLREAERVQGLLAAPAKTA